MAELEFTRKDLEVISEMKVSVDHLREDIAEIKGFIQTSQVNCNDCKKGLSKRISKVEAWQLKVTGSVLAVSAMISVAGPWIAQHWPGSGPPW